MLNTLKCHANVIVVAMVLLIVIASALIASLSTSQTTASTLTAIVHAADGKTYSFPLDVDTTSTIESNLGTNKVTVENACIHVSESDCKNHDCMRQGKIHTPGQRIICLPHEFYIEIIGQKSKKGAAESLAPASHATDALPDAVSG
jgi:hypothetical protein